MAQFAASTPNGQLLHSIEPLVRAAVFEPANHVVGVLLQQAIDAFDARYQSKPGYRYKGRAALDVQCLFGWQCVQRDYYYNAKRNQGYCPADSALGLENGSTPCLTRMMCREGASAGYFRDAAKNLAETGGVIRLLALRLSRPRIPQATAIPCALSSHRLWVIYRSRTQLADRSPPPPEASAGSLRPT